MRHRFQHENAIYHVHTVAAGSIPMVRCDEDRELWCKALGIVADRYALRVMAWCLMTTHWHALVRTPHANIARAMQWLNGVYAQGFNHRHRRRGHLFGARYSAWVIQTDAHLLNTGAYIAWNPVAAGLAPRPSAYRWSSYGATAAGGRAWPANACDELVVAGGGLAAYARFVDSGERIVPAHLAA